MVLTTYEKTSEKLQKDVRIVMLSDFHNVRYEKIINMVKAERPDLILIPGDLVDRHRKTYKRVFPFLQECVSIAPTFMSYGNHEVKFPALSADEFKASGVTLLDNEWIRYGDFCIGGYTPYSEYGWISDFEKEEGYKILLNHEPEYFYQEQDLEHRDIDLILSGHCHGGQIRLPNNIGLFAPEQGFFAKYVHGEYGNMIVGAGLSNPAIPRVPRINNPTEVVRIDLKGANEIE